MENISKRNIIYKHMIPATTKATAFVSPVTAVAGILLSIGILGKLFFGSQEYIQGSTTVFYDLGILISSLILPLISAIIGIKLGGIYGLIGSIISGVLISSGSLTNNISGEVRGTSGLFGAITVGLITGLAGLLCKKARVRLNIKNRYKPLLIIIVTIIGIFAALILNSISGYLNTKLSYMLAGISSISKMLTIILLGFMVSSDIGGPMYLSAYLFSSASIVTLESFYMVAVICASTVGTLTMAIDNMLDGKISEDKIYSYLMVLPCLLGIPMGNILFFLKYRIKGLISSFVGGIVAATLSFIFNLEASFSVGGIVSVIAEKNLLTALNLFVAVISGTIISTFVLRTLRGVLVFGKTSVKPVAQEITA